MVKTIYKLTLIATLIVVSLSCGQNNTANNQSLVIATETWATSKALTYLVKNLLDEKGIQCGVQSDNVETIFNKLGSGEVDVFLDAWLPYTHDVYFYGQEKLVDITRVYKGCKLGLAVPPYVDMDSISDLETTTIDFGNKIYGLEANAGVMLAASLAMKDYGYTEKISFVNMEEADLMDKMKEMISDSIPFVAASWKPHWHFELFGMKMLVDTSASFGQTDEIHFVGKKGFDKTHTDVYNFLKKISFPDDMLDKYLVLAKDARTESEYDKVAKLWIEQNRSLVDRWLNS